MGVSIVTADAFTDAPFSGNPAAVCLLPSKAGVPWMQAVAREMNLSETAFLVPRGRASYNIRWFTPTGDEVALCGHATLASAHVLWSEGHDKSRKLEFHSKSGTLSATKSEGRIELDFPSYPVRPYKGSNAAIAKALGASPKYVGTYGTDRLALLKDEREVRRLSPDFRLLKLLKVRGVAVTSLPSPTTKAKGYDFVSRFFAPAVGVFEDPVTGSAHCGLGPFWAGRLGKDKMLAYQASTRGGTIRVTVEGDRVRLGGKAVTVLRAELEA